MALCAHIVAAAPIAVSAELSVDPSAATPPSISEAMDADIARLRSELEQAVRPSEEQIESARRAHATLAETERGAEKAAGLAIVDRDRSARVVSALMTRLAQDLRLGRIGSAQTQRIGTALALAAEATRADAADARSRLAVARRLDAMTRLSRHRVEQLVADRKAIVTRRLQLQARLSEAEMTSGLIPPVPPPGITDPAILAEIEAVQSAFLDMQPAAPDDAPAPAAGPAEDAGHGMVVENLQHLALVAPDALPLAPPLFAIPSPPGGWPITGQMSRGFEEDGLGPLDKGLTFVTALAQPVRAPRSGTIVFAGPFMSFGLLLIVDHGHEYHSLLAGVARLDVGVGDVVVAGQIVGSIAGSEEAPARLYLELRHNGRPINPLPWLAAREDKVRG